MRYAQFPLWPHWFKFSSGRAKSRGERRSEHPKMWVDLKNKTQRDDNRGPQSAWRSAYRNIPPEAGGGMMQQKYKLPWVHKRRPPRCASIDHRANEKLISFVFAFSTSAFPPVEDCRHTSTTRHRGTLTVVSENIQAAQKARRVT